MTERFYRRGGFIKNSEWRLQIRRNLIRRGMSVGKADVFARMTEKMTDQELYSRQQINELYGEALVDHVTDVLCAAGEIVISDDGQSVAVVRKNGELPETVTVEP